MTKTITIGKSEWNKCPSVRRENKFFYTAVIDGKRYWVLQSPLNGKWGVDCDASREQFLATKSNCVKVCDCIFISHTAAIQSLYAILDNLKMRQSNI